MGVLQSVSLRQDLNGKGAPKFNKYAEEARDRFAERSVEEGAHMSVKRINVQKVMNSERQVTNIAESFMLECRFLANLPKHPHIAQLYAIHAKDYNASYLAAGEFSFFSIGDSIQETLLERFVKWRQNQSYTAKSDTAEGTETKSTRISQRLKVILDVASALIFLADQQVVYRLHPSKVGFDSKYERLKLFDFSHAQEAGKAPFVTHKIDNMHHRAYLAPEFLVHRSKSSSKSKFIKISCRSDVYSFGMLLWETLTLTKPFAGLNRDEHMTDVIQGHKLPKLKSTWPSKIQKLLEDCWIYQPAERPRMQAVFSTLEESLLDFEEELGGTENMEDHDSTRLPLSSIQSLAAGSKNRKIKYDKDDRRRSGDNNKDAKSKRSRKSKKNGKASKKSRSRKSRNKGKSQQSKENGKDVSSSALTLPSQSPSTDNLDQETPRKAQSPSRAKRDVVRSHSSRSIELESPNNSSKSHKSSSQPHSNTIEESKKSSATSGPRSRRVVRRERSNPELGSLSDDNDATVVSEGRSHTRKPSRHHRRNSVHGGERTDDDNDTAVVSEGRSHTRKPSKHHRRNSVLGGERTDNDNVATAVSEGRSQTRKPSKHHRRNSVHGGERTDNDNVATAVSEGRSQTRKPSKHHRRNSVHGEERVDNDNDATAVSEGRSRTQKPSRHHRRNSVHGGERVDNDNDATAVLEGRSRTRKPSRHRRRNSVHGGERKTSNVRLNKDGTKTPHRNLERGSQRPSRRQLNLSRSTSLEWEDMAEHSEFDRSRSPRSTSSNGNSAFDYSERSFDRSESSQPSQHSEFPRNRRQQKSPTRWNTEFDSSARSLPVDRSQRSNGDLSYGTHSSAESGEEDDYPFRAPRRPRSNERVKFAAPTFAKQTGRRGGAAPAKRSLFRRHTGDELFAVASAAKNNPVIPVRGLSRSRSLHSSIPDSTHHTIYEEETEGNDIWPSEQKPIGLLRPAPHDTAHKRPRRPPEAKELGSMQADRLGSLQRAQYKRSLLLASGQQQGVGKMRRGSAR